MYHSVKARKSNGLSLQGRQSILSGSHLRNSLPLQNAHRSPLMRLRDEIHLASDPNDVKNGLMIRSLNTVERNPEELVKPLID